MNNTKQIIDNHNKRILNSSKQSIDPTDNTVNNKSCNCRQTNTCPLNGNCLQSSIIYQATVKRNDNDATETYIGLTENDFKTRFRNHTSSSVTQNTGTLLNLANTSGPSKTTTLTTLFHGESSHLVHLTTAQVNDAIFV